MKNVRIKSLLSTNEEITNFAEQYSRQFLWINFPG